jgi:predicted solute-binding protein
MNKKKKDQTKYFLMGVPEDLHRQIKVYAFKNNISMAEVGRQAIAAFLKIKE